MPDNKDDQTVTDNSNPIYLQQIKDKNSYTVYQLLQKKEKGSLLELEKP